MPTITTMEIPRPTGWVEFETIVVDAMKLAWTTSRLQKNGRPVKCRMASTFTGLTI